MFTTDLKNKDLIIINLETKKKTIKENFLDGKDIKFIKVEKRNECLVIASEQYKKVCLIDYKGNKLAQNPVHPFSLIYSNDKIFKFLN